MDFPIENMITLVALVIGLWMPLWMPLVTNAANSLWANREIIKGWFK